MKDGVVIITGASKGIGAAVAKKLAAEGFESLLIARDQTNLEALSAEIRELGGRAHCYPCDVSNIEFLSGTISKIKEAHRTPIAIINNVGIGGPYKKITELTLAEWNELFNVNLTSAFVLCSSLLTEMAEMGGGKIINISSIFGLFGGSGSVAYSTFKHGLIGFSKSIAAEWGDRNIQANVICPGYINTDMNAQSPIHMASNLRRIPEGRLGLPSEVANLVAFLMSSESSYVNGSVLPIDGGFTAQIVLNSPHL